MVIDFPGILRPRASAVPAASNVNLLVRISLSSSLPLSPSIHIQPHPSILPSSLNPHYLQTHTYNQKAFSSALGGAAAEPVTSTGGAKNPFVMQYLEKRLYRTTIADTAALGINPDAKEAILFALLGNEALAGEPLKIGTNPSVLMGKFSFAG